MSKMKDSSRNDNNRPKKDKPSEKKHEEQKDSTSDASSKIEEALGPSEKTSVSKMKDSSRNDNNRPKKDKRKLCTEKKHRNEEHNVLLRTVPVEAGPELLEVLHDQIHETDRDFRYYFQDGHRDCCPALAEPGSYPVVECDFGLLLRCIHPPEQAAIFYRYAMAAAVRHARTKETAQYWTTGKVIVRLPNSTPPATRNYCTHFEDLGNIVFEMNSFPNFTFDKYILDCAGMDLHYRQLPGEVLELKGRSVGLLDAPSPELVSMDAMYIRSLAKWEAEGEANLKTIESHFDLKCSFEIDLKYVFQCIHDMHRLEYHEDLGRMLYSRLLGNLARNLTSLQGTAFEQLKATWTTGIIRVVHDWVPPRFPQPKEEAVMHDFVEKGELHICIGASTWNNGRYLRHQEKCEWAGEQLKYLDPTLPRLLVPGWESDDELDFEGSLGGGDKKSKGICPKCSGAKQVQCSGCHGKGVWGVGGKNVHKSCKGSGRMKCGFCKGRGSV